MARPRNSRNMDNNPLRAYCRAMKTRAYAAQGATDSLVLHTYTFTKMSLDILALNFGYGLFHNLY